MKAQIKNISLLSLMILSATALRLLLIGKWDGLSFDEIASVSVALQPLSDMWQYLQWEMHPPLHFVFLHYWIQLFGSSEFVIRLSSVVLGAVAMFATYKLNTELFNNKKAGLYGAALSGFIFLTLFYSLVARMYILFFLLAALSFYFFLKAVKNNNIFSWLLYALTTTLALYTHLTAAIIPVIQIIYTWYLYKQQFVDKKVFKKIALISGLVYLLYAPWFVSFVTKRLDAFGANAWYTFTQADKVFFLSIPSSFIIGNPDNQIIPLLVALLISVCLVFVFFTFSKNTSSGWNITPRYSNASALGISILYLPMIVLFLADLNSLRFYFLPCLGLIIILTQAIMYIKYPKGRMFINATLLALFLYPLATVADIPDIRWPNVAEFIETRGQTGDSVITGYSADLLALKYYYEGSLPVETFADPKMIAESQDDIELAIRTNSIIYVNDDRMDEFAELVGDRERLFFLFSKTLFGRSYESFTDWFIKNDWQVVDEYSENNFSSPTIWLLEKNN